MALYSRDNARRSLIDTVSYRAVSQLATALGYVVMVRGMTEQDFGVFNLLYAFIPFVSTFASLGLDQTLRRYQPEYLRSGNTAASSY
jgi:O-antigen/teichoic acid export membrane protein